MKKRLLDYHDGVSTYHMYDDDAKKTIIQTVQDVEPILDITKRALNNSDKSWKGDMHHVAAIPLVVIEEWARELGDNPLAKRNEKWFIAKINNSDFKDLRTKEGRI